MFYQMISAKNERLCSSFIGVNYKYDTGVKVCCTYTVSSGQ